MNFKTIFKSFFLIWIKFFNCFDFFYKVQHSLIIYRSEYIWSKVIEMEFIKL